MDSHYQIIKDGKLELVQSNNEVKFIGPVLCEFGSTLLLILNSHFFKWVGLVKKVSKN